MVYSLFRRKAKKPSAPVKHAALSYEPLEVRNMLATFAVANLNDSGAGSLRQAVIDANALAGADTISFNVAGSIQLVSALPKITDEVDIDGATAPGFAAAPVVEVDFNGAKGLRFEAGSNGSSVESLALVDASGAGVKLNSVSGVSVVGNYIGVGLAGAAVGNGGNGVELIYSSSNTIGGDLAAERNVISANGKSGIYLKGSSGNDILGNFVGTDAGGTLDFGNRKSGVLLTGNSVSNRIGGVEGNVISGNERDGVYIKSKSHSNLLAGNFIGTTAAGSAAIGNGNDGIKIEKSDGNLIGDDDTTFALSNVISGNGANGITLHKASGNRVSMNYIGTDAAGMVDLGNVQNGILVKSKSADNLIGGEATGGNDPTNNVFVRPPQGNLISGNDANGVLINGRSTGNQLSGNFIGTRASGNAALGNALDGILIENADGNSLIGCLFQNQPFVFYNVISGNGGNGLRVSSADDTTIQANFFGIGADNISDVGNVGNGVVVEGSSTRTVMGGPIPLGNVVACNDLNGIVVQDTASFFTTYNTFCGLAAFRLDATLGNGLDGMLITSTGGDILIRTNVVTRNGDDGIEISGKAQGVRVAGNIIGLNTNGLVAMGNIDNGVEVGGNAHDIIVGGPQPTFNVIPRNTIGSNGGNGVAIVGTAHDILVNEGYIGLDVTGQQARGNGGAGVLVDAGTYGNTIGSPDRAQATVISGNTGNGIVLLGTHDNSVINSVVGLAADETTAIANGANGILITASSYDNVIGSIEGQPTNIIASNIANGIFVESGTGNASFANSIFDNGMLGIDLAPGANLNQAAPVLTSLQTGMANIQVTGTLASAANATFLIEFFASNADDDSGETYLGATVITTDANGNAAFVYVGPLPPSGATFITATATDAKNNTSEFSGAVS
jgi:parallel beta-helix repeat protein